MTTQQVAHTPGPWRISGAAEGKGYSISAKRGLVALVRDDTHPLADVTEGQAQANARLIAAAPELLACLKEALELIQEDIDNRDGRDNFGMCCGRCDGAIPVEHSFGCRAKAAISKAETGQC